MTGRLVIRLEPGGGDALDWLLLERDAGEERFGRAEAPDMVPQHVRERARRVDLVFPGVEVICRRVELPARSEAQARAALGFLLEDDLADPPESMHFALGRAGEDGRRSVCGVSRDRLQARLSTLAAAGLVPDRVMPDFLLLGSQAREAVILETAGWMTVALGPDSGFAAETDLGRLLLAETLEASAIDRLRLFAEDPEHAVPAAGRIARAPEIVPALDPEAMLRRMAAGFDRAAVDLCQGDFAGRRGVPAESRKLLGAIAAVAGLLVLAGAMLLLLETARYERQAAETEARTARVFRAALPEAERIVNPALQLANARARLAGGTDTGFLDLADTLVSGIAAVDGVRLASLRYAGDGSGLQAELAYRNFDDLEAIKEAVAAHGVRLEETTARQENGRVVGSVRLEPAG